MSGFESLYSGFSARADEERKAIRRQEEQRDAQEMSILQSLAHSPDKQISRLALAGMLNFADPRAKRKGIAGFLGETEGHPALKMIDALSQTPIIEADAPTPGLPGQTPGSGQIRTPPAATGAAAGAATSPVTGGSMMLPGPPTNPGGAMLTPPPQPPPTSTGQVVARTPSAQAGLPPPQPGYAPPSRPPVRVSDRRLLSSGPYEDRLRGLVEGAESMGAKFSPEQVQQLALELSGFSGGGLGGHGAAGQTYAEGEITPDPDSPTGYSQTLYLRADPSKQQKIPASPKTAMSSRAVNTAEQVAHELYGPKYPKVDPRSLLTTITPEEQAHVAEVLQQRQADQRYLNTGATSQARAEAPLTQQQLEMKRNQTFQHMTNLREDWQKAATPARELKKQLFIMEQGLAASKNGDRSAGDQAVLVTFQKMLDPLSVVREAEYFRSAAGLSLMQRAQGAYDRMVSGGASVPLQELESYAALARQIASAVEADAGMQRDRIAGSAQRWEVNPQDVFGADAPQTSAPGGQAAPGGPPTPGGVPGQVPGAAVAPAAPVAPKVWKVGDLTPEGKVVAVHPTTGRVWLDVDGKVPDSWKVKK